MRGLYLHHSSIVSILFSRITTKNTKTLSSIHLVLLFGTRMKWMDVSSFYYNRLFLIVPCDHLVHLVMTE